MNLNYFKGTLSFVVLAFFCSTISSVPVSIEVLKNRRTGQRVVLMGDRHMALPSEQQLENAVCDKFKELVAADQNLKIYFEGTKNSGITDEIMRLIGKSNRSSDSILRQLDTLSLIEPSIYVDIENRACLNPLTLLAFLMRFSRQMTPYDFKKLINKIEGSNLLKPFINQPLMCFIKLLNKETGNLIESMKELLVEDESLNRCLEGLRELTQGINKKFVHSYKKFLAKTLIDLTNDEDFCTSFLNTDNSSSFLNIDSALGSLLNANAIKHVLSHKSNCLVIVGYLHTDHISKILKVMGFQSAHSVNRKRIDEGSYGIASLDEKTLSHALTFEKEHTFIRVYAALSLLLIGYLVWIYCS